jgi:hypothetical protein
MVNAFLTQRITDFIQERRKKIEILSKGQRFFDDSERAIGFLRI